MSRRSRAQRISDTLALIGREVDAWVASADTLGNAHLIPLSYYWDGSTLTLATPRDSRTAVNLIRAGRARLALGPPRDVVMIEGSLDVIPLGADAALEEAHAIATEFDPRTLADEYVYLRITPDTVQAWRDAEELVGRQLMRRGEWLA
jgi:hypothetical protein